VTRRGPVAEINSPAGRRKATAGCATHLILQPNAHTFILMSTHENVDGLKWRRDFKRQCQGRKPRETQGGHKKTVIFWPCRSWQLLAEEERNHRQEHTWGVHNEVPGRGFAWVTRSRNGRRDSLVGICRREKFKIRLRFPAAACGWFNVGSAPNGPDTCFSAFVSGSKTNFCFATVMRAALLVCVFVCRALAVIAVDVSPVPLLMWSGKKYGNFSLVSSLFLAST
jgi:hypothetical protein